jgi:hypothetical protein
MGALSRPNTKREPPLDAQAQRTLEGVSSGPWFGKLYLPIIADITAESPWLN